MAYRQVQLLAVFTAVACLASVVSATVYIVGDHDGWRANFTATNWPDDKTFYVGDSLMFIYNKEIHTVAQVGNKDDFAACNVNANFIGGIMNSGYDVVLLQKPGKMWFICTEPYHCVNGMKLAINVEDVAPTPSAPSSAPVRYPVSGALAAAGAVAVAVLAF